MNCISTGNNGEAKVLAKFIELGCNVYLPFGEGSPVDMIINLNGQLFKIQVKTSNVYKNGCTVFDLKMNRNIRTYTDVFIDYFALYSVRFDEIYLLHVNMAPDTAVHIRNVDSDKHKIYKTRQSADYLIDIVIEQLNENI